MFHVRKMESEDSPFAVELANTMNWNMTPEDFELNMQLEPNGCFILLDGSKPVGTASCISYGKVGWFGNLVVKEAHRKQGAGSQLVKHALNYLRNKGTTTIGLYAYPYLTAFYAKLGFERDIDFMVLKSNSVFALPESERNLENAGINDLPQIATLDSNCFGSSRKRLFNLILQNPNNFGFIAFERSQEVGYIGAKGFSEAAEVGPLICKRSQPKTASRLLKSVLSRLKGVEAYMYLPAAESFLLDVAFKAGFTENFQLTRMFSGPMVAKNCIYMAESLERG